MAERVAVSSFAINNFTVIIFTFRSPYSMYIIHILHWRLYYNKTGFELLEPVYRLNYQSPICSQNVSMSVYAVWASCYDLEVNRVYFV